MVLVQVFCAVDEFSDLLLLSILSFNLTSSIILCLYQLTRTDEYRFEYSKAQVNTKNGSENGGLLESSDLSKLVASTSGGKVRKPFPANKFPYSLAHGHYLTSWYKNVKPKPVNLPVLFAFIV